MASMAERERCPVCGAGAVSALRSVPFEHPSVRRFVDAHYRGRVRARELAGRRHAIDRCDVCGLAFQRFVLTPPGLERLYDAAADAPAADVRTAFDDERALAALRPGARVLDVGAGDGAFCLDARARGFAPVAVELCERRRKHLAELGFEAVADARELDAASFAWARCDGVLEHAVDPLAMLGAVARALAPHATASVRVPDGRSAVDAAARAYWMPSDDALRPLEHVNAFGPRSLAALARGAGLAPRGPIVVDASGALHVRLHRASAA